MPVAIPLSWLQLKQDKLRLAIALLGGGFAVVLIFMQLGFQDALFQSSVRLHHNFNYDIAIISPRIDVHINALQLNLTDGELVQEVGGE